MFVFFGSTVRKAVRVACPSSLAPSHAVAVGQSLVAQFVTLSLMFCHASLRHPLTAVFFCVRQEREAEKARAIAEEEAAKLAREEQARS